jgi:MoaA/NifB/PqqE/SkfB family radical SAM enzyme
MLGKHQPTHRPSLEACEVKKAVVKGYAALMRKFRPRKLAKWKSAGILLTYRCNAACAHCYENSGPNKLAIMPSEHLRELLREFKKLGFTGRDLHFAGGEPFFDYKHLIDCFNVAKEEGMLPLGKLETNGFWCKSEKIARERMTEIKNFGIGTLLISCDPFHQEFVPIEAVKTAERIGNEVFDEGVVVVAPRDFLENPIEMMSLTEDEKTEIFRGILSERPLRMIGRAANSLAHLVENFPKENFAGDHCGRKLLWKKSIHIDPHGNVFPSVCAGIAIGNTMKTPLSKIHDDFEINDHPMVQKLVDNGPLSLMEEAIQAGFADKKEGYSSKCHLCHEARAFFWQTGMYGDEVAPEEAYVD